MAPAKKPGQKGSSAVVDKTFGLKNANRSHKVQVYREQLAKEQQQRRPKDAKAAADAEERRRLKEAKKAREAELAKLFQDVDQQQRKKKEEGGDNDGEREGGGEAYAYEPDSYLFRPEDFDEVEYDGRQLEEKLELERKNLEGRTDLTAVTEQSFQAWKQKKRDEAAAKEAERIRQAKAGHGHLRGTDLWLMDRDLFVDDEQARESYEREDSEENDYDLS